MINQDNINDSLAHTKANCKYHIVFAQKYRRKVFCEAHRKEIMETIKELCRWEGVQIRTIAFIVDKLHNYNLIQIVEVVYRENKAKNREMT